MFFPFARLINTTYYPIGDNKLHTPIIDGKRDYYFIAALFREKMNVINRPPRDGHMALIRFPDNSFIELLQKGAPLPIQEPWLF
jgi:hypothetical protein